MLENKGEVIVYDAFSGPHPVVEWLLSMVEKGADAGPRPVGPGRVCRVRADMDRESRQWEHLMIGVQ
jgi:hypothetical protein